MGTESPDVVAQLDLCPLPTTHRRLIDAHNLWHQTAANYSNSDLFRANLNATIQALRNVTFAVQSEKGVFDAFEAWYTPWQARLMASSVSKWVKDARNLVVKQGDLEAASTADVRLLTWQDDMLAQIPIIPGTSSEVLLNNIRMWELIASATTPSGDLSDAVLEIERRWNLPDLQNREVLDTLGAAYGLLSDLVLDAHAHLGRMDCIQQASPHPLFRATHHRSGTIPCMTANSELRKERFNLATHIQMIPDQSSSPVDGPSLAAAAKRYGMGLDDRAMPWQQADPVLVAERIMYWSKRMLQKDRSVARTMSVRDGAGKWHQAALIASTRAEKHVLIRLVAQFVEQTGADAIIDVCELWMLPQEASEGLTDVNELHKRKNVSGRGEAVQVMVATREGVLRAYITPFSRGVLGGIKLEATQILDQGHATALYLHPVFKVWASHGYLTRPSGKTTRWIWDPDPLDTCYCGGPRRFGSCCASVIRQYSMAELQQCLDEALQQSDFTEAERLAQAVLAQYVIWVRQHTAPTRHIAETLHRDLVAVDIPALDSYVGQLCRVLEAVDRRDDLVPKLRYISGIIGVPEASVRLTALAARLLFENGSRAEAAAELARLGSLDTITDSMAFLLTARVFNRDPAECCRLLERGVEHARSDGEQCFMELQLANHHYHHEDNTSALAIVNAVIERIRVNSELAMALADAFELRWRLTDSVDDFQAAKQELESFENSKATRQLAAMLIDHGDLEEADQLLAKERRDGDVVAHLLTIDVRLRMNRADAARELLRKIPEDQITERLRLPYAYTMGLVALNTKDSELRAAAASMFRNIAIDEGDLPSVFQFMLDTLDADVKEVAPRPSMLGQWFKGI